ncbi:hypothetical protein R69919_02483 [Paraburkholderia gardini]|nr:hypothetical protein R69919_02483 [Paraburkholderia gardini]
MCGSSLPWSLSATICDHPGAPKEGANIAKNRYPVYLLIGGFHKGVVQL